jgi:peptide deformylase
MIKKSAMKKYVYWHLMIIPFLIGGEMNPLPIVQVGAPVLRNAARELTKEEILSPEIQALIEEMKVTMRAAPGVGLAAPQIGQPYQLIVIEDMEHAHLKQEDLVKRERKPVPFHVIINPKMVVVGEEVAEFFEGCLSVSGFLGVVPRGKAVKVECLNEKAEPVTIEAKGWYARILQHEIDHVHGTLFLDRVIMHTIMTEENYNLYWKGKPIEEVLDNLAPSNG